MQWLATSVLSIDVVRQLFVELQRAVAQDQIVAYDIRRRLCRHALRPVVTRVYKKPPRAFSVMSLGSVSMAASQSSRNRASRRQKGLTHIRKISVYAQQ